MKKISSVILSVLLLMCMSVTAFAAESKEYVQTVSVRIGEPSYDYTVTMPANCSLTYGDTDWQHIGDVTVKSDNWANILDENGLYDGIEVRWNWNNDSYLKNENGDSIFFDRELMYEGSLVSMGGMRLTKDDTVGFYLKVPDWSGAVKGTTYTKVITYSVGLSERTDR